MTGELAAFVQGTQVALLAATSLEAGPLTAQLAAVRKVTMAGKDWYRGRLPSSGSGGGGDADVLLLVSGYDKANTAHALTCLLQEHAPRLVLQFGVAGAFSGQNLGLRDLVLASTEIYADTGASSPGGWTSTEEFGLPLVEIRGETYWNEFPLESRLVARAEELLREVDWGTEMPVVASGPCVTLSQVTGVPEEAALLQSRWQALAESMEGAAAAHICALYAVPFLEVRAVSNLVGDRDRQRWDLPGAAGRAARAAAALAPRWRELLPPERPDQDGLEQPGSRGN